VLSKAFALADYFRIPLSQLLSGDEMLGYEPLSEDVKKLVALLNLLSPQDRKTLFRCAELLASGQTDIRQLLKAQLTVLAEAVQGRTIKHGQDRAEQANGVLAG
jgi:hypothetical protein